MENHSKEIEIRKAKRKDFTHGNVNLAIMAFAIGQIYSNDTLVCVEKIIEYAEEFTLWEAKNVLSLENGWETYMENGGEDYESTIYKWAEEF